MRKLLLIGAGVLSLICGLLIINYLYTPTTPTTPDTRLVDTNPSAKTATTTATTTLPTSGVTMEELRAFDGSYVCDVNFTDAEINAAGTYYVHDGLIRGDFTSQSPDLNGTVPSAVIVSDDTMYMWSVIDGEAFGFESNISDAASTSAAADAPFAMDSAVELDCAAWENVNTERFIPPVEVNFTNLQDVIDGMEYGTIYDTEDVPLAN